MKLKIDLKNKKTKRIITGIIICIALVISLSFRSSLADSKEFTREQMQDLVVSTALSYEYNRGYSNYEQYSMDNNKTSIGTTFSWRNPNNTPEMINRATYYDIDCSSFAAMVYMHSLGYDFSEYYEKSTSTYVYNFARKKASDSQTNFQKTFKNHHRGLGGVFHHKLAREISGAKKGEIYNLKNNKTKNIVAFHYRMYESADTEILNAGDAPRPNNYKEIIDTMIDTLQKGDIILYRRYNIPKNKIAGHAMIYVGDEVHSDKGIIHSTGYDYDSDTDPITLGDDNYSVRYDDLSRVVEKLFTPDDSSDYRTVAITVMRPINRFYNSTKNKFVVSTLNENAEARVSLSKLRVEQYARTAKATTKTAINETPSTATKSLSKYNAVNKMDTVEYSLYLENKSKRGFCAESGGSYSNVTDCEKKGKTWKISDSGSKTYEGLVLTNEIPENSEYVENSARKCKINSSGKENCEVATECTYDNSNRMLTCNIESISEDEKIYYRYKVKVGNDSKIINNGMKLKISDTQTLKLSKLENKVHPTYGTQDIKNLHKNINKFKELVNEGKIKYDANSSTGDDVNLNEMTNESISQLGFIRSMYYNTFGINLDYVLSLNIKNAIFDKNSQGTDFAKKTSTEISNLSSETYQNINKMLVKGMYGGRYLRGNDNLDRPGILRVSDLEVGDIVVFYYKTTSVADSIASYMYLGTDANTTHYFARFTSDGVILYSTATNTKKSGYRIFKELYSKNLFVVLRPLQMYGTTIKYNANGGSAPSYYTAHDTYKNLYTPTRESYTLTLQYNKSVGSTWKTKYTGAYIFDSWYSDKDLTEKVTNESKLASASIHTLYAKWKNPNIKLPDPTINGYKLEGWYKEATFENKEGNGGENYTFTSNKTLYAKWEANEYEVEYNPNGGEGSMENSTHQYGTLKALNENTYTKEGYTFDGWSTSATGEIDYLDNQSVKNLTTSTDTVTLYAIWTKKADANADVIVNVSHGTVKPAKRIITKGDTATFTINPNSGYGNPTVSCNNSVTATINENTLTTDAINEDTTCTVTYTIKKYTIKYNSNGGNGTMGDSQFEYNEIGNLTENTFTRDGYDFAGWSLTANGTKEYIDGETIEILSTDIDTIELFALWTPKKYNITYNLNGGALEEPIETYTIETETLTLPTPTKEGFEFTGWTGSNGETVESTVTIEKGSIGDKEYIANWKDAEYKITYASDTYGTITGQTEETVGYLESPTGTTKTITEGYYHLKWAADKNITLIDGKTVIKKGAPISELEIKKILVKENITLTAYHYKTKFTVSYENGDNGTISGIESEEVAENGNVLGTEVTPKKGYTLSHWIADKNVTLKDSTVIEAGNPIDKEQIEDVIITENISFRAVYDYATYGITYQSDENGILTGITQESKVYKENPTGSTTTANEEYFFLGWLADVDVTLTDGKVIKAGDLITTENLAKISVDSNMVFTAKHVKEFLTVYYKTEKGITITGVLKEQVKYGMNPLGTELKLENSSRKAVFTLDKDVVLKDGTKITSGKELTTEQFKQVVVNEDLIATAKYQKEEIVEVPNTAKFATIISVLSGIIMILFGTAIFYTTYKRKITN